MNDKNILAIDYGTKRIGFAICYQQTSFSIPYITLENNDSVFIKIKKIVDDEFIDLIVLGFPKTINDYISERHQLINAFLKDLKDNIGIEIILVDESYSSVESVSLQKEFNIKSKSIKKTKDQNSATIILDRYLNNFR